MPTITVLQGIKDYLKGDVEVVYSKGCNIIDKEWPASEVLPAVLTAEEVADMDKAVSEAQSADVIIAVMGEDEYRVGESRSRTSLELPGRQRELLQALHATGKPVVLVLINGQPLTINWEDQNLPAILEAWFPSFQGGKIIAETLFGDYNPGGKLTVTFPKSVGQIELNFPFKKGSHGTQPEVTAPAKGTQGEVQISFDITNTGKYAGEEVAQLYVRDLVSSVVTYDSRLRGFQRVLLQPNETKRMHFTLKPADLELLDRNMEWTVEPGTFEVRVGASSEDIRLKKKFTLIE